MSYLPGLSVSPAQVATAISTAVSGIAVGELLQQVHLDIAAAIQALPAGSTPAQVQTAINTALAGQPVGELSAQVHADIAAAVAALPPSATPAQVTAAINGATAGLATVAQLQTAISSAAATIPVTTVPASGAAQTLILPASGSVAFDVTLTANCSLSLSGGTPGQLQTLTLILRQDATAGRLPSLPAGAKWPSGTPPTPNTAAGGIDVFTFITPDAGATLIGVTTHRFGCLTVGGIAVRLDKARVGSVHRLP